MVEDKKVENTLTEMVEITKLPIITAKYTGRLFLEIAAVYGVIRVCGFDHNESAEQAMLYGVIRNGVDAFDAFFLKQGRAYEAVKSMQSSPYRKEVERKDEK